MCCGREPGGRKCSELGVCPASADTSYHGINRGKNAGRICWAVAGTFCGGGVQGSFAEKRESCIACDFYKKVQIQESVDNSSTKFLKFIHHEPIYSQLKNMTYRRIKAGQRFVSQGAVEDTAYIIQKGSCLAVVEKDAALYPVDHYSKGDIVGGLGILTGEPRRAHVEAETDMEVWVLTRSQFENLTTEDPDILDFLTEVVVNRLDSRRPTAYRTIGKYVATDIIGRGGYSIVYKGLHSLLGMPVAIKMLRHDMAMNSVFLESFRNEAKTIASLNHDNIIRIYDIEERYRTVFIITELVSGEGFDAIIQRLKRVPADSAAGYLIQICSGLEFAHRHGIIHRDINPSNILVLPGGHVKILDFGLACACGTQAVDFSGTTAYMAPEQITGDIVDTRTDVYAMGILAYEAVTGEKPFRCENPRTLEEMHLTCEIPDPAGLVPDLPKEIGHFIKKACRRSPDQRFQNMKQVRKALLPLAAPMTPARRSPPAVGNHKTSLILSYDDGHRTALGRILETFRHQVKSLGMELETADFSKGSNSPGSEKRSALLRPRNGVHRKL